MSPGGRRLGVPSESVLYDRARGSNRLASVVNTIASKLETAIAFERECRGTVQVPELGEALEAASAVQAAIFEAGAASRLPLLTPRGSSPEPYARDGHLLKVLATLKLPVFGKLSDSTVLTLRKDSGALAQWRADLREGLAAVERIPANEEDWDECARSILAECLSPSRTALEKELRGSRILAQAVVDVKTAALGAVGGVIGGGGINWLSGLGTAVATTLVTYLERRRQLRPQQALLQHYVFFTEAVQHGSRGA